jgi:nicotinate-nucleotide--dimethylbenzimidazole phosphoribosyltransferase
MHINELIAGVQPPSGRLRTEAQRKIDHKTKPLGSLGRLEEVAVRLCQMQDRLDPVVARSSLVVFAGDHGVAREGVSAFPAEVTPQMVLNFLSGGAAINVLCRQKGIELRVADLGVDADFPDHPRLIKAKVRRGTRSFLKEPALTRDEVIAALEAGGRVFTDHVAMDHPNLVAVGEMGIGNSSAASALIAAACGLPAAQVTGRGTGVDDAGLARKVAVIDAALALHRPDPTDGIDLLAKLGGLEIAGIAGFTIAAARAKVPTVLDGLIATSGGLVAAILCPAVKDWLFSGHRSVEIGQARALEFLGLEPLVDLGLRLGEGTGAALAIHFIDAAARIMCEMASFESAGVSNRE